MKERKRNGETKKGRGKEYRKGSKERKYEK